MIRAEAPWKVGRWAEGEYVDRPWYAHDRGAWFGRYLPGQSFKTHAEALRYARYMAYLIEAAKEQTWEQ